MIRLLLACALALWPLPALAQGKPPAEAPAASRTQPWREADGRLLFVPASVSFPVRAGAAAMTGTSEFSHPGEHVDNVVQYRSPDGELIVTAYIYYPGLPHVGLAAYATDQAIRLNSESEVQSLGTRIVAAGRVAGAALRTDYRNYRNGHASSAAFIKLDRWLIKLRVTAPERRRADVEAAMSALLAGIRFEASRPRDAAPLELDRCGAERAAAANPLPDNPAEILAHGLVATFDGGGMAVSEEGRPGSLRSRVPPRWCLSSVARIGDGRIAMLRALPGQPGSIEGTSRLVAILSDSGGLLEVVESPQDSRFLLLSHQIGETLLLGSFDAMPSDQQIADILSGADRQGRRTRARVRLGPGQGNEVEVVLPEADPAPRPVT